MYWFGPVLALVGLVLLIHGFHKNSRGVLVVAGITLFLAGSLSDFFEGFVAGVSTAQSTAAAISGLPYFLG